MTPFEEQVAEALRERLVASPLEMFDELNERDLKPLADYLAPRVALAIWLAAGAMEDHELGRLDPDRDRDEQIRERALLAFSMTDEMVRRGV